jgi:predicted lysophospholipase L1 biosynthesis ABC-type transport system permease subunit
VLPLKEKLVGDDRLALLALFGAVGLLLLISCTNVAGLQMARGAGRGRELATRAALGAGRRRLVRQLLAESLVLAVVGGLVGLLVATVAIEALGALIREDLPQLGQIRVDRLALVFSLTVSCLTGIAFGAFPAWTSTRLRKMAIRWTVCRFRQGRERSRQRRDVRPDLHPAARSQALDRVFAFRRPAQRQ